MKGLKLSVSSAALGIALGWGATASAQIVQGTAGTDPASVQTATSQTAAPASVAEVVVTGTHIQRPNETSVAPITTVTSEEIKDLGAVNISDVLNRLPQVYGDNQVTYQDSNGRQQVNLRGLGFNRSLTLLDGQRLATAESVNVNDIPVALIDRIDILTGGASSVYGADAVGGVTNFILKKDFKGIQLNASYGGYTHDNGGGNLGSETAEAAGFSTPHGFKADGGALNVNVAGGAKFFDDHLSVEAFAGFVRTDPVYVSDRDFSSCYLQQVGANRGANSTPICQVSTSYTRNGIFAPGDDFSGATYSVPTGGSTFVPNNSSFNYKSFGSDEFQRRISRYNGGLFLNYKFNEHHYVYFNYMIANDTSVSTGNAPVILDAGSYGYGPYTTTCNNPLLSAQQQGVLCGANAGTNTTTQIGIQARLTGAGRSELKYLNLDQRISTGLHGDFLNRAFVYDVGAVLSRGESRQYGSPSDANLDYGHFESALNNCSDGSPGCVPLNIFNGSGGTPALEHYLFPLSSGHSTNTGTLYDYTANLTTDLGKFGVRSPFAKSGIEVATGGELRQDREVNRTDLEFDLEENNGSSGNFGRSQNVREGYVEASIPLIDDNLLTHTLQLTGSHRWSKYSSSSKIFTTWEVGGVYAPIPDVAFRASYNKASREPTIYESNPNPTYSGGAGSDPCAPITTTSSSGVVTVTPPAASLQACELTGLTAAQYGKIAQCANSEGGSADCLARSASTPAPETAHSLTFGAVIKPRVIPNLTLSVDRYDIEIDDQIGFGYPSEWTSGCIEFADPFYCSHIHRNPDGTLTSGNTKLNGAKPTTGFIDYGNENQYKYYAKGFDFQAQYMIPAPMLKGKFNFSYDGSRPTVRGGRDAFGYPVRNGIGYFGTIAGQPLPDYRSNLRSTYTTDDHFFSLSLNWRYIAGTTATNNSGNATLGAGSTGFLTPLTIYDKIKAYNYFDLAATFHIRDKYTVTILANNIFDLNPPTLPNTYDNGLSRANTWPQIYDALGRFVQVNFNANF